MVTTPLARFILPIMQYREGVMGKHSIGSWNYLSQATYEMEGAPTIAGTRYSPPNPTQLVVRLRPTYRVVLEKGEDEFIVARVLEVPGAISQGKNRDEALKNVLEALTAILEETSPEHPSEVVISWEEK